MFVLSCEPATCYVPEWHKDLFVNHEETVSSNEGWAPGSLNLAQAFATKLRALLAHGDLTRLLVDVSKAPDDPARFSRFSATLGDEQRRKLDDRHHSAYLKLLRQRIVAEQRKSGAAVHLSIRTDPDDAPPLVRLIFDPSRDLESTFVNTWGDALRAADPELSVALVVDPNEGLAATLRDEFRLAFGSVSLVVAQSCFLDGRPLRWEILKRHLLATLPPPGTRG